MIVLVGFMGAGKTTVGRVLGRRLHLPVVDTDDLVETRAGRRIAEVFASEGEDAFRDLEEAAVADALAGPDAVVSLGGGACGRAATRTALVGHTVVHLDVSLAQVRRRTRGDADRPVLHRPGLAELFAARRETYAGVASFSVDTDGRPAAAVAQEILDRAPSAIRRTDDVLEDR